MTGSIRQRGPHSFLVRVYLGLDRATGKERWDARSAKSRPEARALLVKMHAQRHTGAYPARRSRTAFTYVLFSAARHAVKIDRAVHVPARVRALEHAGGERLRVLAVYHANREAELHERFKAYRGLGEWFPYTAELRQALMAVVSGPLPALVRYT